ncbi:MAG: RNA-binding protein [Alphaproteobacteria bacterium]|nr:RNA-binding protein [Alphaproteobacteria bacterium]MBV8409074.1 RNA-binding protein [Alphaproteobacteria bacterium]
MPSGPLRTCIATGEQTTPERLIRFVVAPDGEVVPDLARRLPGRGLWVRAERTAIERAIVRKLFARAARSPVKVPADLGERVERLLLERALADLARARRAGRAVAGFAKVEQLIAAGRAGLLVVADEAEGDGLRKLAASGLAIVRLGDAMALGGIFGRERTVYAAVARDDAAGEFIERIEVGAARWRGCRSNSTG